jgi:hypothetical protein
VEGAGADLSAPGRHNRRAAVQLDPDVPAFASMRNNRSTEKAKSTEEFTTRHA